MVRAQLLGVSTLDGIDEVTLAGILLERVAHRLVQAWDKGRSNFLRTLFTRGNDVLNLYRGSASMVSLIPS